MLKKYKVFCADIPQCFEIFSETENIDAPVMMLDSELVERIQQAEDIKAKLSELLYNQIKAQLN